MSAWSQDVVKPGTTTTAVQRLPAPKPTARQLPNGQIEVSWPAVEGAIKYDMWRSVPPTPQTVISRPDPSATTYIDTDVRPGSTYYYLVAAVNSSGISGLRAGTMPVTVTASTPAGTPTEVVRITVSVLRAEPPTYRLTFPASTLPSRLERLIYRPSAADPNQLDPASAVVSRLADIPGSAGEVNDTFASDPSKR
jgi:hypothetical protein